MMEASARSRGGDGRTEDDEGKEGLSLEFGCASSHLYPQQHHKLLRTGAFPFRVVSSTPAEGAAAAAGGTGRPPLSPHTLASAPCGGIVGGGSVFTHSSIPDSYGTPRNLQFFVAPFNSLGVGGDATLELCSPFTAAQWQELHRQALIFKYIMASTPIPPELLFGARPLADDHSIISSLGRGGDYLNLRLTGTNGDLEPGRCRRTDGKKWRCSRDVAPGQKYCERHMHRARPRSRKPVELDRRAGLSAAATSEGMNHANPTTTAGARPCTQSPPGELHSDADLKFPFHFMVPQDKKLRFLGAAGGDMEAQGHLLHSKMAVRNATFVLHPQQHHEDDQLNLNCTNLNNHHICLFPSTDNVSSLEDVAEPPDRRGTPRRPIGTWSRESPFHGFTVDSEDSQKANNGSSPAVRSQGLSPSNLTLSMSGTCSSDDHDLRAKDWGKPLAPTWMYSAVSPIGGPLAEVLQTSTSTVSFQNEPAGHGKDDAPRGSPGLIDLMSKTSCDSEGTSLGASSAMGFSSPTCVLHKTLVSLSDSSSNSSPRFGPGPRAELAFQWAGQSN